MCPVCARSEVVTRILESYVPAAGVAQRLEDADLARSACAPTPGTPWPTLGALIDAGGRLVGRVLARRHPACNVAISAQLSAICPGRSAECPAKLLAQADQPEPGRGQAAG